MGAYMELAFLNHLMGPQAHQAWMTNWRRVTFTDMAAAVKAVGAEHFILSSDLGQIGNPVHADGMKQLVAGLNKEGVSDREIDLMMRKNPAKLLGLEE
jgi:microsomal dipeptidase-like Zn-dependent dipeptidase